MLGAAAIGGVIVFQAMRQGEAHDAFLCPANGPPVAHTVVVVDQTTQFTGLQIETVRAVVMQERDRIPIRGRLTLLYLNPERPSDPIQIFSRCNPGAAADTDIWLDDPARAQREWQRQFEAPLDVALTDLLAPGRAGTSPIIETLRGLVWRPDFSEAQAQRRVVLVSDMLQNSDAFSFYSAHHRLGGFSRFVENASNRQYIPPLGGVQLEVRVLRSEEAVPYQDAAFGDFWRAYFAETHVILSGEF